MFKQRLVPVSRVEIFGWGSTYRNPVESESKSVLTEKPLKGGEELWLGRVFETGLPVASGWIRRVGVMWLV